MTRNIWLTLIVCMSALALFGCTGLAQPTDREGQIGYPVASDQIADESTSQSQPTESEVPYPAWDSDNRVTQTAPPSPYPYPTIITIPSPVALPTPTPVPTLSTEKSPPRLAPGSPVTISSIDMIDAHNGWAIGGPQDPGDHILRTRDGGQTWVDVTPPETVQVSAYPTEYARGFFPESESGWVTFHSDHLENNHVWRTTDGGRTWSQSQPVPNDISSYWPRFLQFVDDNHGWLVLSGIGLGNEYVTMFSTTDGGESWAKLVDPNTRGPHGCMKTGLVFADAQHAWLTTDCAALVSGGAELDETHDGGRTWGVRKLPLPEGVPDLYYQLTTCSLHSPNLFSPRSGSFVLKCQSTNDPGYIQQFLLSTMDGGESWLTKPYPGGSLLMLDQNFGWALSRDIYQTTDGGLSWEHLKTVNWNGRFDFVDENTGFALARSHEQIALVRTDDGGRTWQMLEPMVGP